MERTLAEFPVCEYAFVEIPEIPFREEVRYICRIECPRYGTSWSCPPAVGTVKECEARCAGYDGALIFTTIAEDVDTEDMSAMLATRMEHEEVTRQIRARMAEDVTDTLVLNPAPSVNTVPIRRAPAAIRTGCSPASRATGFW